MYKLLTNLFLKFSSVDINIKKNIFWLLVDKVVRMGGGLFISLAVARYLGPAEFGIFNFCFSFVWLFSNIVSLGLDEIINRDLLIFPAKQNFILGTSFILKCISGIFTTILILISIRLVRPNNETILVIVFMMAISMIMKMCGVIRCYFETKLKSKFSVITENVAFIIASILKLYFLYQHYSLKYFVFLLIVEVIISSLLFVYFYISDNQNILKWSFSKKIALRMLKDSWPLILSGIAILLYVKSDQVLIAIMMDDESAGLYAAAAKISEMWYFIPTSIVVSFFPSIIQSKLISKEMYLLKVQQLFDFMTTISILIAVIMTFFSKSIISLFYGSSFESASSVLSIHIWSGVFVFLGVASSKFCIVENLQKSQFYRTLLGAIANIVLNIILIPKYGINGSAIATVISYGVSVFSAYFFIKTRPVTIMMFRSFELKRILSVYIKR